MSIEEAAAAVVEQWMKEPEGSILLERAVCALEVELPTNELRTAAERVKRMDAVVERCKERLRVIETSKDIGYWAKRYAEDITALLGITEKTVVLQSGVLATDKELGSFADTNAMRPKVSLEELKAEYEKNLKEKP